jgi:hypothetical protein
MKYLSFTASVFLLAAGVAGAQDAPPQAAIDVCLKHADAYSGVAAGTATFQGSAEATVPWFGGGAGDAWRLRVDVPGAVAVSCTVSADGKRVAVEPAST